MPTSEGYHSIHDQITNYMLRVIENVEIVSDYMDNTNPAEQSMISHACNEEQWVENAKTRNTQVQAQTPNKRLVKTPRKTKNS